VCKGDVISGDMKFIPSCTKISNLEGTYTYLYHIPMFLMHTQNEIAFTVLDITEWNVTHTVEG
jgi:hypothetical protein